MHADHSDGDKRVCALPVVCAVIAAHVLQLLLAVTW